MGVGNGWNGCYMVVAKAVYSFQAMLGELGCMLGLCLRVLFL